MKLSDVTRIHVTDYIRCDDPESDFIDIIMAAAKKYVAAYTGLSEAEIDGYEDLTAAFFVLCAEMYDNRQSTVQNDKVNPMVLQILGSHSKNLI